MGDFLAVHWMSSTVVTFIVLLTVYFLSGYVMPALKLGRDLKKAIKDTQALKKRYDQDALIPLVEAELGFAHNEDLQHAWREYTETVHEQFTQVDQQRQLHALRATVPAETFFNTAVLVDTKLNTEFFKHLPGILTGIGIIGTFMGLLLALPGLLEALRNMTDMAGLQPGLVTLVEGVQEAFIASGIAISVAMFITFFEKQLLNRRYKETEQLAQVVDALYDAGAGEEYLRELVENSGQHRHQSEDLKNEMMKDLGVLMDTLASRMATEFSKTMEAQTQRLITEQKQTNQLLVEAIKDGLKDPLNKVEESIVSLINKQEEGVSKMVEFAVEKLGDMFVEKLDNFGALLQQSTQMLDHVRQELQQTIVRMDRAGNTMIQAGDRMHNAGSVLDQAGQAAAASISIAGNRFEVTSESLNETMQKIIRSTASISDMMIQASSASDKLKDVQEVFVTLKHSLADLDRHAIERIQHYDDGAKKLLQLSQPIELAVNTLAKVSDSLTLGVVKPVEMAVEIMKDVVMNGADHMNIAGHELRFAADEMSNSLTSASNELAGTLKNYASGLQELVLSTSQTNAQWQAMSEQLVSASTQLKGTSGDLDRASSTVDGYLERYEQHNKSLSGLMDQLLTLIKNIDERSMITQMQVEHMQQLAAQMRMAQQETLKYSHHLALSAGRADIVTGT